MKFPKDWAKVTEVDTTPEKYDRVKTEGDGFFTVEKNFVNEGETVRVKRGRVEVKKEDS